MSSNGLHGNEAQMAKFVSGLKSRYEETRIKTAYELQRYVTTELREVRSMLLDSEFKI